VLVLVEGETSFPMRREEGLKTEERSKYSRLKCVLDKGMGRRVALAKKWEGLKRARWR